MNQIYLSERAAMYKLAENVADYVVLNKKSQDRIKPQPGDDADMCDAKEKLHMVYIGLYKSILLACAQLTISLFGSFQYVKNLAKHYDWAGQLEQLKEQAQLVREYRDELKDWKDFDAVSKAHPEKEKGKEERPDPKKAMGPGPRNPLHWAVALTVPDQVVHFVQSKEYPINALTPQSWTAAHLAAREGNTKIMSTLLTAPGINLQIRNREGRTPLHIAAMHNKIGAVKLLLQRHVKLIDMRDNMGRTAFLWAAPRGHVEVLKVLKQHGQDLNESTTKNGWTALHLAAESDRVDAVKFLVANGTNKNAKVRDGQRKGLTAKQVAEQKGKNRVLEFL
jgi:ankyrin repeat protein